MTLQIRLPSVFQPASLAASTELFLKLQPTTTALERKKLQGSTAPASSNRGEKFQRASAKSSNALEIQLTASTAATNRASGVSEQLMLALIISPIARNAPP